MTVLTYGDVVLLSSCYVKPPNISAYVQHEWNETIWYQDQDGKSKIGQ